MDLPDIPVMQSPPGAETVIDGRSYLYFGGTGYLGLAGHPEVIAAACEATQRYGVHTATSRTGFGNSPVTLAAEAAAAEFFGMEASYYFTSGYVTNHILIQALAGRADAVLMDEAAHYCIEEAVRLTGRAVTRFHHRDAGHLGEELRRRTPASRPLVLTDGVFPLTGALAPIREYLAVLAEHAGARLMVDDAHGIGVLGEHGRGSLEHWGLWTAGVNATETGEEGAGGKLFVGGTLAKAMGGFGGIIPGSRRFIERVRRGSHYYDGASAPPSAVAGATVKAMELVRREPGLREQLGRNSRQLRGGLRGLGLAVEDWPTPNVGVRVGGAANMRRIHGALKERGILVPYIAEYAGSGGEGLLRVAVCATHTEAMIGHLLGELREVL